VRWLVSHMHPTLNKEGKLVRLDGITSDITQSKEAEIALRHSEYKFRSLIEYSADAIMIVNENNEVSYASDSLYRIMGYSEEEILGVSSLTFIHPDDIHLLREQIKNVNENPGKPFTIVYRRRKKDGAYIWCEGTATNLTHLRSVQGVVVIFRDITARIEAEKALKNSEQKFRALIENSSDVTTVLNERQEIIYVSDSLFHVTGFTPEEIMNVPSLQYVHPDDHEAARHCWNRLKERPGSIETFTYRRLKKDGTYIWVESTVNNMLHDPVLKGMVINFRDITERIVHEQELTAANNELVKSNKELDKFVYSVSHDLRAPLSSVLGLVEYSETETTDVSMLETLKLIKGSINKLDGFVQDILDYSRNSRMSVNKEVIDFNELLQEVTANLKFMSAGKGNVDIKLDIKAGSRFTSDRGRIAIVMNNLISNAIRYYNPAVSRPYVEISILANSEHAEIIVRDNGIGIDEKYHDKIFDMFFRVSKKSVGSGLGLYIVKETIEKLDGEIGLTSEKDKGTEFKILIPNLN
jgi:PAS domain S-box-containing protein